MVAHFVCGEQFQSIAIIAKKIGQRESHKYWGKVVTNKNAQREGNSVAVEKGKNSRGTTLPS